MNIRNLSGARLEKDLAAKLEPLLGRVGWLRGWQLEHVREAPDTGFDLLVTVVSRKAALYT